MVGMVNYKSSSLRVSLCSLAISTERGHLEGTVPGGSDLNLDCLLTLFLLCLLFKQNMQQIPESSSQVTWLLNSRTAPSGIWKVFVGRGGLFLIW